MGELSSHAATMQHLRFPLICASPLMQQPCNICASPSNTGQYCNFWGGKVENGHSTSVLSLRKIGMNYLVVKVIEIGPLRWLHFPIQIRRRM
jgi:hypothetical protein